ncbi:MAG: Gfo/Idh/MocA family protein [Rubripirellula sp.]
MDQRHSRRSAVKMGLAGASLIASRGWATEAKHAPIERVKVGFVGVGAKGSKHLQHLIHMEGVELRAVCDVLEGPCVWAQRLAEQLDLKKPTAYTNGEQDFRRMCEEEELDLVYTATPWRWHARVCLAALEHGIHAATEIPMAVTVEDCWKLVEASEKAGKHCSMMENVNYQQNEMTILSMIRKGLLGELVHGSAGYMHDTRYLKINDHGDGLWLGDHHAERNGNLYPTHGLGPLAWYMNINRGDRLEYLVSMSSNARGMNLYAQEHLPKGHPKRERDYKNGDVNTCLIGTANGLSISIVHDTDLPRPYSRTNLVQGTRGAVRGFPEFKVCLEGKNHRHKWSDGDEYTTEHEHPLWKASRARGLQAEPTADDYRFIDTLHNGDYLEDYRLIEAIRAGVNPDFDVYDGAAWSAVAELSERSVEARSAAVDFPDFTRGKWKTKMPLRIMGV